jgi:hypothetical protein
MEARYPSKEVEKVLLMQFAPDIPLFQDKRFSNAAQRTLFHFSAAIFGPEGSVEAVFQDGRWER